LNFFRYLLRLRRYKRKSVEINVFQRGSIWAQISDGRGSYPSNTVGFRKLMWLPFRVVSECPQCIVWFCHKACVWLTDGQTDRHTDGRTDRITTLRTELAQVRRAVKNWSRWKTTDKIGRFCPPSFVVWEKPSCGIEIGRFSSRPMFSVQNERFQLHDKHEGLLTPTAQRYASETWNAHPFYWGFLPLGPKLRERNHPLLKCWYRLIGSWSRYSGAAKSL